MAYGYPIELRVRAMAALDSGLSYTKVSTTFNISRNTLYNWTKRRDETGSLSCKRLPTVRPHRKLTRDKLLAYITKHSDHYLYEIASFFNVSAPAVQKAFKKFGISRKKNDPVLRARRAKEASISSRNRDNRS